MACTGLLLMGAVLLVVIRFSPRNLISKGYR
jgi:hypothetical protein